MSNLIKEINKLIKDVEDNLRFYGIPRNEETYENQLTELDNKLIQLCKGNIFYIRGADNLLYVFAKESKDIKKLKNIIETNKINIHCCLLSDYQLNYLHNLSFRSKHLRTDKCGCFNCLSIFDSKELDEVSDEIGGWTDFNDTPVCPYCGVDSVLFEGKNLKITRELLYDMELFWFGAKFDLNNWKTPEKPILLTVDA